MRTPFTSISKIALIGILLLSHVGFAQTILDAYIAEGLKNNLVLEQRSISLEKALLNLKIARGRFMPSVALQANYTHGEGGRAIPLPVGDLLNPVYEALGSTTRIENEKITFFPQNFYDAKVRTSMPLFNSDLIYNKKIQEQQILLKEFEVDIYKRELIRDIKSAYFNYLSAQQAIGIYKSALGRAQEGKRVNESLLSNGKGLPAYVLRSQSEIENIQANLTNAEGQAENAKLYFNYLLSRDSNSEISMEYDPAASLAQIPVVLSEQTDTKQREELRQVQALKSLNGDVLKMNQLYWAPRFSGFLDLGAQGENMKYTSQSNYFLVGLQFEMPLFTGLTNRYKIQQSKLDITNSENTITNTNYQLNIATGIARNKLASSWQNYLSAQKQLEAAQSYQKLIDKGYKEGVNTFIESIDARNQLTGAQFLVNINQYNVLIAEAALERETAAYQLNQQ